MASHYEDLADYRRRVAAMYAAVREGKADPVETCRHFRASREELFRTHPQSALSAEQKAKFAGLWYYDYNPAYRFLASVITNVESEIFEVDLAEDGLLRMRRFGRIRLTIGSETVSLTLFWIMGYGGGIFLPFRDLTNGRETYGGGRYLLDTIKHADLGQAGAQLVIDFNYAYNPSCAFDPTKFVCPLAPPENWVPVRIEAGEKRYLDVLVGLRADSPT